VTPLDGINEEEEKHVGKNTKRIKANGGKKREIKGQALLQMERRGVVTGGKKSQLKLHGNQREEQKNLGGVHGIPSIFGDMKGKKNNSGGPKERKTERRLPGLHH